MALSYFDCNANIGKRGPKLKREPWRTEEVIASLERTGIAGAVVYAAWSKDYSPTYGNERLVEEIKKSDRLYGCYTIMPGYCGIFLTPEEMIADFRAKGMVAAKMFPASHYYNADEITMGAYYTALEEAKIPLFVDYAEIDLRDLKDILANHPSLNIVLQNMSWAFFLKVLPYLKKYSNLHIELSNTQANRAVEILVRDIGVKQILFGTGLPKMSPGAARAFIDYAMLSDEEKQMIAGGNLARLCGIPLPAPAEVTQDEIAIECAAGKPMSSYVFDSHTHYLEDNGQMGATAMLDGDLDHMNELNRLMGVDDYAVAPWLAIWTDSEAGMEVVEDMAKRDSHVWPFAMIDPNYVDDIEGTARKLLLEKKFPAIKLFFARTRVRYNDPVYEPFFKLANELGLFGLMDNGSYPTFLADVAELAEKYPNVTLFLDHAAQSFGVLEAYIPLVKKYDNLYLQLTYTTVTEGGIELICREGVAHKALYGTDAPMRDPRPQLGWLAHADISVEDKKLILGENMRRIASRCKNSRY